MAQSCCEFQISTGSNPSGKINPASTSQPRPTLGRLLPAISQYLPWISLVLVFGILIDIVILWYGEWRTSTRIAKLAEGLVGLLLLGLMIQGLTSLLNAAGVAGFADGMALISAGDVASMQLAGMVFLRIALIVAFIGTGIEAVVQVVRLVQERLRKDQLGSTGLAGA